jgi:hypothetical protein
MEESGAGSNDEKCNRLAFTGMGRITVQVILFLLFSSG